MSKVKYKSNPSAAAIVTDEENHCLLKHRGALECRVTDLVRRGAT